MREQFCCLYGQFVAVHEQFDGGSTYSPKYNVGIAMISVVAMISVRCVVSISSELSAVTFWA